jgi:transposase-like protein
MKGHGAKYDRKKEEAIAALLTQKNIEEAARSIGIGHATLLRWLKEPEFDTAYREARRAAFRQSVARLQQASGAAVTTPSEAHDRPGHSPVNESTGSADSRAGPFGQGD